MYAALVIVMKARRMIGRLVASVLCLIGFGCMGGNPSCVEGLSEPERTAEPRLQVGDQIEIQVYREPQLSGTFRVDASGFIRHPLCGAFTAAGLTPEEAEQGLTQLLSEHYLVNPRVIVSMISAQRSHVVILGEVKTPGVHSIPVGETITLLRAIAEAGGFTDLASLNRVTVVRTVDGQEKSIRVRVRKMISGEDPDLPLRPNDVIMVPQVVF